MTKIIILLINLVMFFWMFIYILINKHSPIPTEYLSWYLFYFGGTLIASIEVITSNIGLNNNIRWYHTVIFVYAWFIFLPLSLIALLVQIAYWVLHSCLWAASLTKTKIWMGKRELTLDWLKGEKNAQDGL